MTPVLFFGLPCSRGFCSATLKSWRVDLNELFHFIVTLKNLIFPFVLTKCLLSLTAFLVGKRAEVTKNKAELSSAPEEKAYCAKATHRSSERGYYRYVPIPFAHITPRR